MYIPLKSGAFAMIVELKRNGSTDGALEQIRRKQYFASLEHYSSNLLFAGVNYDEHTKAHECKIERFEKPA